MKTLYFDGKASVRKIKDGMSVKSACERYGRLLKQLESFTDFLEVDDLRDSHEFKEFNKVNNECLTKIRQALVKLSRK